MTAITEHIKHESKDGTLVIDVVIPSADETGEISATATFECRETGAIFSATYDRNAIAGLHRIFAGMPELFADFTRDVSPTIHVGPIIVIAEYKVTHGRRVHEFQLSFGRKVYDADATGVIELQQENRVLRRRVNMLEELVKELTEKFAILDERLGEWNPISRSFCERAIQDAFTTSTELKYLMEQKDDRLIKLVEAWAQDFNTFDYERVIEKGFDVNMYHHSYRGGSWHYIFDILHHYLGGHIIRVLDRIEFIVNHGLRNDHEYTNTGVNLPRRLHGFIGYHLKSFTENVSYWKMQQSKGASLSPHEDIAFTNRDMIITKFKQLEKLTIAMK